MLFQLSTGLLNIAQWYAFKFFFTTSHYAMAYVAAGAVLVHIGVKLPVIRRALGEPVDDTPVLVGPTRRTLLRGTWLAVALATVVTAGQTIPLLAQGVGARAAFGARAARGSGEPVGDRGGRAAQRAVTRLPADGDERIGDAGVQPRRTAAMPQATHRLPIACVEGWSVDAEWTGVVLADLVAAVGGSRDSDVRMISLEPPGPYSRTVLPASHARDTQTLIALKLNGQTLDLDHGYPCRLIAPTRPGVLQTKWLSRDRGGGAVRVRAGRARRGRRGIRRGAAVGEPAGDHHADRGVGTASGVVLHDFVFAPVCVALGFAGRRLIPGKWWAPIAVAAFCSVVLAFWRSRFTANPECGPTT